MDLKITTEELRADLAELLPSHLANWRNMQRQYPMFAWKTAGTAGQFSDGLANILAARHGLTAVLDGRGVDIPGLELEITAGKKGVMKGHPATSMEEGRAYYFLWIRRTEPKSELEGWAGRIEIRGGYLRREDFGKVLDGRHGTSAKSVMTKLADVLWTE